MSVRSSQAITVEFTTSRFDTGAATNGDSTPTGTLVVNGADNGATVTVTNIDTGRYKAAVTLPTLSVGDVVEISVAATVNSVAGKGIVWRDTKDVVIDSAGLVDANTVKVGPSGSGVATTANLATRLIQIYDTDYASIYDTTNKAFLSKLGNFAMGGSSLALTTGAISGTTLTLSGAVAFQSTFAVTGATTLAALSMTTLTASGAVAFQSTLAVTGTTTLTGAVSATNASNDIRGVALTAAYDSAKTAASVAAIFANAVESGVTFAQLMEAIGAVLVGKRSNAGTATEQYDAIGNPGTSRVVGNLDSSGNGTPTLTL